MLVKAHVRCVTDVLGRPLDKPMVKVSVETEAPLEIVEFTCFGNDVSNGNVEKLRLLLGHTVLLPLTVGEYKGKPQVSLSFGEVVPAPPQQNKPVQKAG